MGGRVLVILGSVGSWDTSVPLSGVWLYDKAVSVILIEEQDPPRCQKPFSRLAVSVSEGDHMEFTAESSLT
jgi:hypothetical protein